MLTNFVSVRLFVDVTFNFFQMLKPVLILLLIFISTNTFSQAKNDISVGDAAIDFSLKTLQKEEIQLNELNKNKPAVLVVLRGWPGYQCPICTRQVAGLVADADEFKKYKANILMVYPGPSEKLKEHAAEFSDGFDFPEHFYFVFDPDYSMINKYGLRWDAPKETAYPSTFVIDKSGEVVFAKVSETHGGRAENSEILQALKSLN